MSYILVVDDDELVLRSICHVLEDANYRVMAFTDGNAALEQLHKELPSLVILDIIMPDLNGMEMCRRIRANPFWAKLPIIFLTAKSRPLDVINGLDLGADDYLVKPFEVIELPARIRSLMRRMDGGVLDVKTDDLQVGDLTLWRNKLEAQVGARVITLTPIEHRLLHYLMTHAGQPMSVDQLLQDVWEYPPGVGDTKLVRVHISNLRDKIEPDSEDGTTYIQNVRGQGYMIANT